MAKVLVTGASGFIGQHLASALVARGDEVTCLVRKTSQIEGLNRLGVRLVVGDITEPEGLTAAVAGQEAVYHLAGLTLALRKRHFFQVNQGGIRNIARACVAQGNPPVLVVVSSLAAAGPALDGRPKIESDPALPVSAYGHSKRAGELEAESFADRAPTTIVRPPIVLGEGDRLGLPMFRSVDKIGVHIVPGLGRHRFSLIHAADLVELLILAAQRGKRLAPPGQNGSQTGQGYYFAACEDDLVYDDLGRLIGKVLGRRRVAPVHIASPVVWMVAAAVEAVSQITRRPLYLHIDKVREVTAGSWICSPRRAKEELGFSVKAPLVERLRQTARWYRKEGWL
ncbi:MAG: NAD-dependent epimerase/dehydratase family protein [Thermoguttaceae bacterium]|jgi:nucleoside-diphosphate-sugar epimerase